jgi:hypothetical protein
MTTLWCCHFENSIEKQFDEVCSKAFAIGFSREIVIDLL